MVPTAGSDFGTAFGVIEVVAETKGAGGSGPSGINVAGVDAGDENGLPLGAGDGNVETALALFLSQRAEVEEKPAALVFAVANAEDHHVGFVALDGLKVTDEAATFYPRANERVECGSIFDLIEDFALLGQGHRGNRDLAFAARGLQFAAEEFHGAFCFGGVGAAAPATVDGVFDEFETDAGFGAVAPRIGVGDELAIVEMDV